MTGSASSRTGLFASEPVPELRGLASLSDPDDAGAVIDLAVIGARGDGKTQFIVHAIRAMHAHAPALDGAEQALNRDVLRLVLDPRATRPDATPPGVVPHATFRVRTAGLFDRLGWRGALRLACRAAGATSSFVVAALLVAGGAALGALRGPEVGLIVVAGGLLLGALAAMRARRRIARAGEIEVAFWDVAGEQVYSSSAVDYYNLLAHLVEARRARAAATGRSYAFAPVLICNPLALGTSEEGSPYERMRQLLPLFAALDDSTARALVAINRWAVVDPICARGALRDEVVAVASAGRGEEAGSPREVAREQVRAHCLDAEDGKDGDVRITYVRYDTAIKAQVAVDRAAASIEYAYDDGPGAFSGDAAPRFLDWVVNLVPWRGARRPLVVESAPAAVAAASSSGAVATKLGVPVAPMPPASMMSTSGALAPLGVRDGDVWARPAGAPRSP